MSDLQAIFDNISIVMINTTHPGNIGAAARALKNMGLRKLVLVDPRRSDPLWVSVFLQSSF